MISDIHSNHDAGAQSALFLEEQNIYSNSEVSEMFHEVFAGALKLKGGLLLSSRVYSLYFPKPGEEFRPSTMLRVGDVNEQFTPRKKRTGAGSSGQHGGDGKTLVKLCLFPALFSVPKYDTGEPHVLGDSTEQCVVRHNNFTTHQSEGEFAGQTLVAKAVVLT